MRKTILTMVMLSLLAIPLRAQTADEIIANYVKTSGGMDKINAVKTLVRTGKYTGGGGFELAVRQESKRPNFTRSEYSMQGLTGVNAYNGKIGWKIEPWGGKKDPELMGEDELKGIQVDADFDGPLVNYKEKGNTVKFLGTEPVDGTDAYKLQVTIANGDIYEYFMDTDYYVPIQIDVRRKIRGEEQEYRVTLGDYKEVDGWYLPFSIENGSKGSQYKSTVTFEKIEANVPIDNGRFEMPPLK